VAANRPKFFNKNTATPGLFALLSTTPVVVAAFSRDLTFSDRDNHSPSSLNPTAKAVVSPMRARAFSRVYHDSEKEDEYEV
jgi:hypothetical protein